MSESSVAPTVSAAANAVDPTVSAAANAVAPTVSTAANAVAPTAPAAPPNIFFKPDGFDLAIARQMWGNSLGDTLIKHFCGK